MKVFGWILLLLVVAAAAAFGWHWIAADPGNVVIHIRGWRMQTSLLVLVVGLIVLWAVLAFLLRVLSWPFRAAPRHRRNLGQKRLAAGVSGLIEGRHRRAERKLLKAARFAPLRGPARLLEANMARTSGDYKAALTSLDNMGKAAPRAALVVRAQVLRESGKPEKAAKLLVKDAEAGILTPAGWRELVRARLAAGDAEGALEALGPVRKSHVLGDEAMAKLEKTVLTEALRSCEDAHALGLVWRKLPRACRKDPQLVMTYVRHAADGGAKLAAASEIKSVLRKQWNGQLAALYIGLDAEAPEKRLRQGEKWLKKHPHDVLVLASLGVLCAGEQLPGKAREYLEKAIEQDPELAPAWATLGDLSQDEGDVAAATRCYRKALGAALDDDARALLLHVSETLPSVVEQHTDLGIPQLRDDEIHAYSGNEVSDDADAGDAADAERDEHGDVEDEPDKPDAEG